MGGSRAGAGPGGECMCPKCGTTVTHDVGTPCYFMKCPKCGSKMVRK
jgi:Zn finger protein HypA/HybF involved in hydrogenase expression